MGKDLLWGFAWSRQNLDFLRQANVPRSQDKIRNAEGQESHCRVERAAEYARWVTGRSRRGFNCGSAL